MRAEKILKICRYRFGTTPVTAMLFVAALLVLAMMAWTQPVQAAPLAGTSIGNQASATYTDASAVVRTATSNEVKTIVLQVASMTLVNTQAKTVAAGGTVYFPHTLTNTGNGSDSFGLTAVDANTGTINFSTVAIYPDANGDGVPDSFTAITSTGALGAGSTFNFIVAATASGASTDGQTDTITLTATSTVVTTAPAPAPAVNTDTVNVSGNAIIVMTKSVSPGSGTSASGALTYTLTYTNTGNATATALVITDVVPAGMTYNAVDKARWSVSGATALTDAADGVQPFGAYTINYAEAAGTITATINQVLPGESRTLTFEVTVNASAAPGVINNTATFGYNDGSGAKTGSSNPTPFTVNQFGNVAANGSNVSSATGASEPINVAAALQGSTVIFPVYIWNTGNGSDSFDVTVASGTFPAGTSFVLYKTDGVTPLVDTNGNSTPDTGVLASGASYNVAVKAILPAGASGNNGGLGFSATLTATSKLDNTKSDPAPLTLTAITANSVDLTLGTAVVGSTPAGTAALANAASTGFGAGPEVAALTPHNTANPGTSSTFVLKVNNTSATSDNYDLSASTDSTFGTLTLPAGWTVAFKADGGVGDCSTLGAVISNTGIINNATNKTVCAIVSAPSNATAGAQNIYFRALSPTSSASDSIHGAVDVNTIRKIDVTTNQTGQVFPGGTVVYPMTVTNNGNVTEGTAASAGAVTATSSFVALSLADSLSAQGWTSVIYRDVNNNGAIDPGDTVISDLSGIGGLAPAASVPLLVKVFAPAGAGLGNINTTTLTATTTGDITIAPNPLKAAPAASSATDNSTVISGQVTLTKLQALDAACDGAADGAFALSNVNALPGACVLYQITAKNVGTADITTLEISDATPANTVYATGCVGSTVAAAATTAGSITLSPGSCAVGTVKALVPTLAPGATAVVTFGVKINP